MNMPAPYRVEQFNRLAQSERFAFKVFFYTRSEPNRSWDASEIERRIRFDHEFLDARPMRTRAGYSYFAPRFLVSLVAERPRSVIVAGFSFQLALALLYGAIFRAKVLVWSDSNILSEVRLPGWRSAVRRAMARRADAAIACSSFGVDYFKFLGLPEEKIAVSRYVSEPLHMRETVRQLRGRRSELRRVARVADDAVVILLPARLEPEKGCHEILHAVATVRSRVGVKLSLLVVGDGSQREELERMVWENELQDTVVFAGFKEYWEMPRYFALADLVALPSLEEPYGLVVNEALAAGVPVLCSKFAGASDLIRGRGCGIVMDPSDEQSLRESLIEAVARLKSGEWPGGIAPPEEIYPEAANAAIERALLL